MKYATLFHHFLPICFLFLAKAKAASAPKASNDDKKAAAAEGETHYGETISKQKKKFLIQQYSWLIWIYLAATKRAADQEAQKKAAAEGMSVVEAL